MNEPERMNEAERMNHPKAVRYLRNGAGAPAAWPKCTCILSMLGFSLLHVPRARRHETYRTKVRFFFLFVCWWPRTLLMVSDQPHGLSINCFQGNKDDQYTSLHGISNYSSTLQVENTELQSFDELNLTCPISFRRRGICLLALLLDSLKFSLFLNCSLSLYLVFFLSLSLLHFLSFSPSVSTLSLYVGLYIYLAWY